jgi:hypothetical protein
MDLSKRLKALHASLDSFGPNDACPWEVAKIFNALLAEAKQQYGNDPVVKAIDEAEPGSGNAYATVNCGAVRTAVSQLWQISLGR